MTVLARGAVARRTVVASAVALAGCQSILGIESDRPLVPPDGGGNVDAGHPGDDGGASDGGGIDATGDAVDAYEASTPDADAGVDSGPPTSFSKPLQIDASSIFNANSVLTTAVGGMALTPMDGNGGSGNNNFPTKSAVLAINDGGVGLPDDAFFPTNGTTIPDVHLAWSNGSNVANSIVVSATAAKVFTLDVPPGPYSHVQLYATGGGGPSTLNYTLMYADSSSNSSTLSLPDWCLGAAGSGQYVLVSVDRVENGNTFNGTYLCNIYALELNPDTGKSLTSIRFWDTGGTTSYLVFYGATAW
jgi:hypothetical protein